jgi:hypothetical protein
MFVVADHDESQTAHLRAVPSYQKIRTIRAQAFADYGCLHIGKLLPALSFSRLLKHCHIHFVAILHNGESKRAHSRFQHLPMQ